MLKMTPKTNKYLYNAIQNNNSLKPNKTLNHSKSEIYRKKTPINNNKNNSFHYSKIESNEIKIQNIYSKTEKKKNEYTSSFTMNIDNFLEKYNFQNEERKTEILNLDENNIETQKEIETLTTDTEIYKKQIDNEDISKDKEIIIELNKQNENKNKFNNLIKEIHIKIKNEDCKLNKNEIINNKNINNLGNAFFKKEIFRNENIIINNVKEEELKRLIHENNILFRKNKCLEEEIILLKSELENLNEKIKEDFQKQIEEISEKSLKNLSLKNNEINTLQKENLFKNETINFLKESLKKSKEEIEQLNNLNEKILQNIINNDLIKNKEILSKIIKEKELIIKQTKESIIEIKNEEEENKKKINDLIEKINKQEIIISKLKEENSIINNDNILKNQLNETQNNLLYLHNKYNKDIESLKSDVKFSQTQTVEKIKVIENLKKKLKNEIAQNVKVTQEKERISSEKNIEIEKLKKEYENIKKVYESVIQENKLLIKEIDENKEIIKNININNNDEKKKMEKILNQQKEDINVMIDKISENQKEIEILRKEKENLNIEIEEKKKEIKLEKEKKNEIDFIQLVNEKTKELNKIIENNNKIINEKDNVIKEIKKEKKIKNEQINQLANKINDIILKLNNTIKEKDLLIKQYENEINQFKINLNEIKEKNKYDKKEEEDNNNLNKSFKINNIYENKKQFSKDLKSYSQSFVLLPNKNKKHKINLNESKDNESINYDILSKKANDNITCNNKIKKRNKKREIDDIEYSFQTQVKFFKNLYMESQKKLNNLSEQINDLLLHVQVTTKTKLQISQIYQLLGYSPRSIQLKIGTKKNLFMNLFNK